METPKSGTVPLRSMRNHTPRLSERKKKLFESRLDTDDEDTMGLKPLSSSKSSKNNSNQKTPKSTNSKGVEALLVGSSTSSSCKKTPRVISFFEVDSDDGEVEVEMMEKASPSTRRSVRLSIKKNSPNSSKSGSELSTSPHKENIPVKTPSRKQQQEDKQLQKMFTNSMQITPREKVIVIDETSSEDELEEMSVAEDKREKAKKNLNKRCVAETSTGLSPMRKVAKKSVSPLESGSISTKSFYSGNKVSPTSNQRSMCRNLFGQTLSPKNANASTNSKSTAKHQTNAVRRSDPSLFNRGVRHNIKKRNSMHITKRHFAPVDIDRILSNVRNEKLRKLIVTKREEKQQIEKVHSIFRKASNPIAMAKPLTCLTVKDDSNNNNLPSEKLSGNNNNRTCYGSSQSTTTNSYQPLETDFSDIECDSVEEDEDDDGFESALRAMDEEVIPMIKCDDAVSLRSDDAISVSSTKRKFFKSGRQTSTKKEVKITGNIRATVKANGKLRLVEEKKKVKKRLKIRNSSE